MRDISRFDTQVGVVAYVQDDGAAIEFATVGVIGKKAAGLQGGLGQWIGGAFIGWPRG
ncbi:MAG: hypothetical protein WBF89_13445 [Steroidobacteraceae bacterium]